MDWPQFAKRLLLDDGVITERETLMLKRAIFEDGVVDREEIEFLVDLKRDAREVHPDFDRFLFRILHRFVMADNVINDAEARWLRTIMPVDRPLNEIEREFLIGLREAAKKRSRIFDALFAELVPDFNQS
jgi:hypothetical protein